MSVCLISKRPLIQYQPPLPLCFSAELQSKLCSLRESSRRRSGRTLQAARPHMSYTGLCYLCWPAADSHMSKPGERALYTLTGGAGMSKACIVQWNNVPPADAHANTHTFTVKIRFTSTHTHTLAYTNISHPLHRLPTSAHK